MSKNVISERKYKEIKQVLTLKPQYKLSEAKQILSTV